MSWLLSWVWALLAPPLLGALLARAVIGARLPSALHLGAAIGLGHGSTSILFAALCALDGAMTATVVIVELALMGSLALACRGSTPSADVSSTAVAAPRWLLAAVALAVLAGVSYFVLRTINEPHGQWDAWAIWNLRARFLARGGFSDAFSEDLAWSHVDYPLLVPASVARAWVMTGSESLVAPAAVAGAFWLAILAVLLGGLQALRGGTSACVAVVVLLSAPMLTSHAAAQYADVPVAFFLLATLVFAALSDQSPTWRRALVLAGAHAGLGAWTKNEGALMLLSFLMVVSCCAFGSQRRRASPIFVALGALLPCLALLAFKAQVAPTNDLVGGQDSATSWARLCDSSRWLTIVSDLAGRIWTFARWPSATPMFLLAGTLLARVHRPHLRLAAPGGAVVALTTAGYLLVFVLTPADLSWHLRSSADRLLLQLWPAAVFIATLALGAPQPRWRRVLSSVAIGVAVAPPIVAMSVAWGEVLGGTPPGTYDVFDQLAPSMPARGRVGIVASADDPDRDVVRLRAQYALAPRIVVPGDTEELVIVMPGAAVQPRRGDLVIARGGAGSQLLRRSVDRSAESIPGASGERPR